MRRATSALPRPQTRAIVLAALAIALLASGNTSVAGQLRAAASKRVVAEAENPALEETVLTTLKGRTLYSLSVEKHGRFVCTGPCLATWHPLVVPAGMKPTGPVKLATIVRPDTGVTQVTYRGRPLYRFGGDGKAGQANGEGIKDVGTWHAASVPKPAGGGAPPQQPAEPPYPY